jgi:hypothetical protein
MRASGSFGAASPARRRQFAQYRTVLSARAIGWAIAAGAGAGHITTDPCDAAAEGARFTSADVMA